MTELILLVSTDGYRPNVYPFYLFICYDNFISFDAFVIFIFR